MLAAWVLFGGLPSAGADQEAVSRLWGSCEASLCPLAQNAACAYKGTELVLQQAANSDRKSESAANGRLLRATRRALSAQQMRCSSSVAGR